MISGYLSNNFTNRLRPGYLILIVTLCNPQVPQLERKHTFLVGLKTSIHVSKEIIITNATFREGATCTSATPDTRTVGNQNGPSDIS